MTALPAALTTLDGIILGKEQAVRLSLACLLARGHLLIEDVPGVGKTTLAHALAQVLGLSWQRVQFTSVMNLEDAHALIAHLKKSDPNREIAYWLTPVIEFGRLA